MQTLWTRREFSSLLAGLGLGRIVSPAAPNPATGHFKLGIITDEITQEFGQALDFIASYSLSFCELRELWRKNIMDLPRADLDRAKELIVQHHLSVSDIASPIFKYNLPEVPARPERVDNFRASFSDKDSEKLLQKSFELAKFFGTQKVRVFAYLRVKPEDAEKAYPIVRDRLAKAAESAAKNQITLVLENEHSTNIGTGKELGRILRDVNSPHLRGNWDPGNAVMLREVPYPDGYREVRGLFAHMHVKDVKKDPQTGKLSWAPLGGGFIDWRGQLKAVREDGFDGTMSLETHYHRPDHNTVESTRESLLGLLKIMKEVG